MCFIFFAATLVPIKPFRPVDQPHYIPPGEWRKQWLGTVLRSSNCFRVQNRTLKKKSTRITEHVYFCVFTSHEAFPWHAIGEKPGFSSASLTGKFWPRVPGGGVRGGLTFATTLHGALSRKDKIMCTTGKWQEVANEWETLGKWAPVGGETNNRCETNRLDAWARAATKINEMVCRHAAGLTLMVCELLSSLS